ncbi:hypothetical protein HNR46_000096 [Haloferula luteola]|uniref:Uncharacterized protein n=1 Tax=Haloferula luteola TaxID=595692 RepID=A0A840UVX7_9BACT|nr:major capsid protein [Haloferula luteola]MBB5349875.1 hypothetical protein [Haloferula luteola]
MDRIFRCRWGDGHRVGHHHRSVNGEAGNRFNLIHYKAMDEAITTAITSLTGTVTGIGTAAMALVVAFAIWRNVRKAGNKV